MKEMCEQMGGILSASAHQYQDEVQDAVRQGDAFIVGAIANCPFDAPIARAILYPRSVRMFRLATNFTGSTIVVIWNRRHALGESTTGKSATNS